MNSDAQNNMRTKSIRVLKESVGEDAYNRHALFKYVSMSIPLLVYVFIQFDVDVIPYCVFYEVTKLDSYLFFWPSLREILDELRQNGEVFLSCKYYFFSIWCFTLSICAGCCAGFSVKMPNGVAFNSKYRSNIKMWIAYYMLIIILGLYLVLFVRNNAGYDSTRFLIQPMISRGEPYFIRDVIAYSSIAQFFADMILTLRVLSVKQVVLSD